VSTSLRTPGVMLIRVVDVPVTIGAMKAGVTEPGYAIRLEAELHCYPRRVDRDEIVRVLRAFEQAGLEYVLIGATAMGFHGLVRATEDIDLFIRATPDNVDRLRRALRSAYDGDPNVEDIRAEDLLGDYPAIHYYPPTGDLYFDILTRLGDAATFETVRAETKEIDGTRVSVATGCALPPEEGDCESAGSSGRRGAA
jgi:hypothetical protein